MTVSARCSELRSLTLLHCTVWRQVNTPIGVCLCHHQCLARQPRLSYNCPPSEPGSRNKVPFRQAVSTLRKPASEHVDFAWRSSRPLPNPLEAPCGQDGGGVYTGYYPVTLRPIKAADEQRTISQHHSVALPHHRENRRGRDGRGLLGAGHET